MRLTGSPLADELQVAVYEQRVQNTCKFILQGGCMSQVKIQHGHVIDRQQRGVQLRTTGLIGVFTSCTNVDCCMQNAALSCIPDIGLRSCPPKQPACESYLHIAWDCGQPESTVRSRRCRCC